MCPSPIRPPWWRDTGILHDGVMMGNDRKTARKRRRSFLDFEGPFLFDAGWREMAGDACASNTGDDFASGF